jgi:hypothetical protein
MLHELPLLAVGWINVLGGVIPIPTRSLVHISRVVVFHDVLIDHATADWPAEFHCQNQPIDLSRSILLPADSIH